MKRKRKPISDYEAVAEYLQNLEDGKFHAFIDDFAGCQVMFNSNLEMDKKGNQRAVDPDTWREDWTNDLLRYRECNRAEWLRLCHHLNIPEDNAQKAHLERSHLTVTRRAAIIAAFASSIVVLMQLAKLLFPDAESSNENATKHDIQPEPEKQPE